MNLNMSKFQDPHCFKKSILFSNQGFSFKYQVCLCTELIFDFEG